VGHPIWKVKYGSFNVNPITARSVLILQYLSTFFNEACLKNILVAGNAAGWGEK
jgi:hypothetical protein